MEGGSQKIGWSSSNSTNGFITGSGTPNRVAKFTGNTTIGDSIITDNGLKILVTGGTTFAATPIATFLNSTLDAGFIINDDGNVYINSPQYTGFALQVDKVNVLQYITTNSTSASVRIPNNFQYRRIGDDFIVGGCDTNNWYFQQAAAAQITVGAKVHIRGNGLTTTFGLKVENSNGVLTASFRDDGRIAFPLIQTGNAGLSTGDLYVDTAANITGNADLFLARKV